MLPTGNYALLCFLRKLCQLCQSIRRTTQLAALQSKLSTAAQKQANDLTRVQQVVERRRTTPGAVPPSAGALYPGLKVWMPPAFAPPVPPGRR